MGAEVIKDVLNCKGTLSSARWDTWANAQAAHAIVRKHVKTLVEDRPLYEDINALTRVARQGEILDAVQKVTGSLN
jgi:histidine ammonia-lyase